MDFRVLGPLTVEDERGPLRLDGPRVRALLAFLLLHANTPVSTSDLLDELWGEDLPKSGATAVQNAVARLRKALGDRVVTEGAAYLVRVEPRELDLQRFRDLVAEAADAPTEQRAAQLREALGLWRGEALGSIGSAAFVTRERARLEGERLAALNERIDADLALARHAALVPELSALVAENPLDERFRAQLILALYRSGRQAAALDVYRETRQVLADELGLEPGPALRELERAVLRQDSALDPPARAAVAEQQRPAAPRRKLLWLVGLAALFAAGTATAVVLGHGDGPEAKSAVSTIRPRAVSSTEQATSTAATTHGHKPRPKPPPKSGISHHPASTAAATTVAITEERRITTSPNVTTTAATTTRRTTTRRTTTRSTTTTTTSGGNIVAPPLIADTFEAKPDESLWNIFTQGGGPTALQRNGRVEISIPADATPSDNAGQISGNFDVKCLFPDDFDAQVDYELLQWPRANGVNVSLVARVGPQHFTPRYLFPQISRRSLPDGEQYQSYLWVADTSVPSDDQKGRLRIARRDGVFTTYYWKTARWIKLDSAKLTAPALISFDAITNGTGFGRADVSVAFDNFTLYANRADCS